MHHQRPITSLFILLLVFTFSSPALAERTTHSLAGEWLFQRSEEPNTWKTISLPASFEEHEGTDFDGIGIYKTQIPHFELPPGMRAIVHFQAVATLAEVTFNGQSVGSHLGGWTPFRIDVTPQVRSAAAGVPHELTVRVDEKVGHNSQGFLPVFAPHFGGIWQDVQLLIVPDCWIDDLSLSVRGDLNSGQLLTQVPLHGPGDTDNLRIAVRYRRLGEHAWSGPTTVPVEAVTKGGRDTASGQSDLSATALVTAIALPVPNPQLWSPRDPNLYELEFQLLDTSQEPPVVQDRISTRGAFRSATIDGHRLLLNGQPIVVHGVLNWGYAPPRVSPSIDEEHFRAELELARSYGFNLMKFCLWVPPKRYLELADEMGMLTWMEYPTWHSRWSPDQLPTLEREFTEFFQYDRNHPSVLLRSLTCETGTSADLGVIQALYNRCHAMIPGSIVEDDSSWIGWNRIHDFYDDHPYGNNHTWVDTLAQLKRHIAERTPKPLVLGEAIAADTWTDRSQLLEQVGERRPFWLPRFLDGNQAWIDQMREVGGPGGLKELVDDSKHYALLMRKYQIETYRREVPFGGYVVSVIRDMPLCSMGLIDYLGHPKWSADAWNWHGDTMLLLATPSDRRSFLGGEVLRAELAISHFGNLVTNDATLEVTIHADQPGLLNTIAKKTISLTTSGLHKLAPLEIPLPVVRQPTRFTLSAQLTADGCRCSNQWPLWMVPHPDSQDDSSIQLHASCSPEIQALFPTASALTSPDNNGVVVASRLDRSLLEFVTAGGRVLLLPDGETGSFPLSDEWFLRGAPYVADHPLLQRVPRQMLVELQHFDLAGPVVPDMKYLDQIDPILMLWNNHDLDLVKTQGLLFETRVGNGRLLVSALHHTEKTNAVGSWLVHTLADHLITGPAPRHALTHATIAFVKAKIDEQRIDLTERTWQFQPDPDDQGLQRRWQLPTYTPDEAWKPIRIGQAWEGLGYPTLDGWAWYRTEVLIPETWKGRSVYVLFEGADDYYDLYVNGQKIGSGGDLETRSTAFEEPKSHDATKVAQPGQKMVIAVRICDWQGAGGLFRPVVLSTAPFNQGVEILK